MTGKIHDTIDEIFIHTRNFFPYPSPSSAIYKGVKLRRAEKNHPVT